MEDDLYSNASQQSLKVKQLRSAKAKAKAARLQAEEDALCEELAVQESLERRSNASQMVPEQPALEDQRQVPKDPEEAAALWEMELQ